ncbi:hypothetical protein, partial [Halorubrum yunnanense]
MFATDPELFTYERPAASREAPQAAGAQPPATAALEEVTSDALSAVYTLNRRNTTAFTPWIRAVTWGK